MLDIATPKKHSFYQKLVNTWLSFKRRQYLADDNVRSHVYYEFNLDQFFNLSHYLNISKSTKPLTPINSSSNIQPGILGLGTKDVIKNSGAPSFIFKEKNITIFIYKWKFNGLKNRCKIHFYKNEAFLVTHDYQLLSAADKSFIYNAVTQKYLNPKTTVDGILNCKIVDSNNNQVFLQEVLMGLTVSYLGNANLAWYKGIAIEIEEEKERELIKSELANKKFLSVV